RMSSPAKWRLDGREVKPTTRQREDTGMNDRTNAVRRGMLSASAAAALVLAGNVVARATDKTGGGVECAGVNACKGKGSCKGAENACKGKNEGKGKGFVDMSSDDECEKPGGKVVAEK